MTAVSRALHSPLPAPFEPQEIRPGVFGATFYSQGEPLFLRMELLTPENARNWTKFRDLTGWIVDTMYGGIFGKLVDLAGTDKCPSYAQIKEQTGFTEIEYSTFITKAIQQKNKTAGKIVRLVAATPEGSAAMFTSHIPKELHYIAYVTKNATYSVPDVGAKDFTLKHYISAYSDILISMGSDFTKETTFHNRGISRNHYWVLQDKYAGFSMLLQEFTAAFAEQYSPTKLFMEVRPVGSMQCILQKSLSPDDGYVENRDGTQTDITNLTCSVRAAEHHTNFVKVSALTRIYREAMASLNMRIVRNPTERCAYPLAV